MRMRLLLTVALAVVLLTGTAMASTVELYADAAPNVYGSPAYPDWRSDTFAAIAGGTFANMTNGTNASFVGTTKFMIEDEVVYSFGDLGKRLMWVYWIPNETVASLAGRVETSLFNTWGGEVSDFNQDYYGTTWRTPTNLVDYTDGTNSGVFGLAGMAYWGAYGVNTQEALDADMDAWRLVDEMWEFTVRLYNPAAGTDGDFGTMSVAPPDYTDYTIQSYRTAIVPEPATMTLLGLGLGGMALTRIRRKRA